MGLFVSGPLIINKLLINIDLSGIMQTNYHINYSAQFGIRVYFNLESLNKMKQKQTLKVGYRGWEYYRKPHIDLII